MPTLARCYTAHLLEPLHRELVALLRTLEPADWTLPTTAGDWRVRDVVAHILDGDLRRLSFVRDGHEPPLPQTPLHGYDELVGYLNMLNRQWVDAAARLSPALLIDLIEHAGTQAAQFMATLDPDAPARFAVDWAGEDGSRNWFETGREYTERWHHQQQIRDAVGAPLLHERDWLHPVLALSVRALRRSYADVVAPEDAAVVVELEGDAGGAWSLIRECDRWTLHDGVPRAPSCTIGLDQERAWRLFFNQLDADAVRTVARIDGDEALADPFFATRAVMV